MNAWWLPQSNCTVGIETILGSGWLWTIKSVYFAAFFFTLVVSTRKLWQSLYRELLHPPGAWYSGISYRTRALFAVCCHCILRCLKSIDLTGDIFGNTRILYPLPFLFILYYLTEVMIAFIYLSNVDREESIWSDGSKLARVAVIFVSMMTVLQTTMLILTYTIGTPYEYIYSCVFFAIFIAFGFGFIHWGNKAAKTLMRCESQLSVLQVKKMSLFVRRYSYMCFAGTCITIAYIFVLVKYPDEYESKRSLVVAWVISILCIYALEFVIASTTYMYFVVISLDRAETESAADAGGVVMSKLKGKMRSTRSTTGSGGRAAKKPRHTVEWSIMDVTNY